MPTDSFACSIIIPSWDGREMLRGCLASLDRQEFRDFEVIVVDNGSVDGTAEMLAAEFPAVRLVRFETNQGFARPCNEGVRAARGRHIVLLNNDIECEPKWLGELVRAIEVDAKLGSAASRMMEFEDRERVNSAGDEFSVGGYPLSYGSGRPVGPEHLAPREPFAACAGAAIYRREALQAVAWAEAPFDERFFAIYEDVDLGFRLRLGGWRCLYVPTAVCFHRVHATLERVRWRKGFLERRNYLILLLVYLPFLRPFAWRALSALGRRLARKFLRLRSFHMSIPAALAVLPRLPHVLRRRRHARALASASGADPRPLLVRDV